MPNALKKLRKKGSTKAFSFFEIELKLREKEKLNAFPFFEKQRNLRKKDGLIPFHFFKKKRIQFLEKMDNPFLSF